MFSAPNLVERHGARCNCDAHDDGLLSHDGHLRTNVCGLLDFHGRGRSRFFAYMEPDGQVLMRSMT